MQENNISPIANSPQTTEAHPVPAFNDQQPKANSFLVILLSTLLLISVAIAGFFAYQTQQLVKELQVVSDELKQKTEATSESTSELVATESSVVDPTADWKTYVNNVRKYTIKYPSDWILDKSEAELPINDQNSQKLVISKGEYKLTILWPSAYGPSICLFDDQSRVNAPDMAGYCEGKYVETKNILGTITHRRLESPNKYNQFEVYSLDERSNFVTVPPIRFDVPASFDKDTVSLMDQILLTYTSLN